MTRGHWDRIYGTREATTLGWYEAVPVTLEAVTEALPDPAASVLDVGAGASTLVDHLLRLGSSDLTLLDISAEALGVTRRRLGARGNEVQYVVGDVLSFAPTRQWDLWHDRATFHFLTEPSARAAYRATLLRALAPGGRAVIATFAAAGPDHCAGLPVTRYDADALVDEFSDELDFVGSWSHVPGPGATDARPYVICRFDRKGEAS